MVDLFDPYEDDEEFYLDDDEEEDWFPNPFPNGDDEELDEEE